MGRVSFSSHSQTLSSLPAVRQVGASTVFHSPKLCSCPLSLAIFPPSCFPFPPPRMSATATTIAATPATAPPIINGNFGMGALGAGSGISATGSLTGSLTSSHSGAGFSCSISSSLFSSSGVLFISSIKMSS